MATASTRGNISPEEKGKSAKLHAAISARTHPSQDELSEYFTYDPQSGALVNKIARGVSKVGKEVGTVEVSRAQKLYRRVSFKGKRYYAHVLIWVMLMGAIPTGLEIDHRDGDGLNNVITNMRVVTHGENMRNRKAKLKGEQLVLKLAA